MGRYVLAFCAVFGMVTLGAQNKEQGRLENCGVVMEEILGVPDNIPRNCWRRPSASSSFLR